MRRKTVCISATLDEARRIASNIAKLPELSRNRTGEALTTLEDTVEELVWLSSLPDVSDERVCGVVICYLQTAGPTDKPAYRDRLLRAFLDRLPEDTQGSLKIAETIKSC